MNKKMLSIFVLKKLPNTNEIKASYNLVTNIDFTTTWKNELLKPRPLEKLLKLAGSKKLGNLMAKILDPFMNDPEKSYRLSGRNIIDLLKAQKSQIFHLSYDLSYCVLFGAGGTLLTLFDSLILKILSPIPFILSASFGIMIPTQIYNYLRIDRLLKYKLLKREEQANKIPDNRL